MLNVKDHKTIYMFDPFEYLGPKRRQLLNDSWAGIFRDHIRQVLPVGLLAEHYSANMGRPTNELVSMMGAMLLQHMHDLTDQETVEQFSFNIQWHYALDITSNSDCAAYVCPKSIWTIRSIMTEHGLYDAMFDVVGDKLCKVFDVDTSLQRIDSVHIFSNMRHLGRIGILSAIPDMGRSYLQKLYSKPLFLYEVTCASLFTATHVAGGAKKRKNLVFRIKLSYSSC